MSLELLKEFLETTEKKEKNSHGTRAKASFLMLEHVDLMIDRYFLLKHDDQGDILLDVFGLMQGLFVAIDALYDLAIGLTQYKYHINVNNNKILHELKYIRNDIVGHPTHRTYHDGGIGFSILSTKDLSKDRLSYHTYIYEKNKLEIKTKEVLFRPLTKAYKVEKEVILKDIYQYLTHEKTKTKIPEQIYTLFITINKVLLNEIKESFVKEYKCEQNSNHRFLWRAKLLSKLIDWDQEDSDLKEAILHMSKTQALKMYLIALDLEKRRGKDLFHKIPKILKAFYKFVRKNEKIALPLLERIHDYTNPLFQRDLLSLMALNMSPKAQKLLEFLRDTKEEEKVYLIGSMMRAYRPKK